MAVDGYLNFDTKINTDGFTKGTKNLSSKVIDLKNKITDTEREINKLTSELNQMANTNVKSKTIENLEKNIEEAKAKLLSLEGEAENIFQTKRTDLFDIGFDDKHLDSILAQDSKWTGLQEQISKADEELRQYENDLKIAKATEGNMTGADTEEYATKQAKLSQLCGKLDVYKSKLSETQQKEKTTSKQTASVSQIFQRFGTAIRGLGQKISGVFKGSAIKGIKSFGTHLKNLVTHTKKTNNQMGLLGKSLKRIKQAIAGLLIYKVLQSGLQAIKEGLQELAKESPTVNKQLSTLLTSLTYLKNSLASAFAPILNVVTPILTKFMDSLSSAITKVGEFMSALTGQSTYTKAIKVQQDYADSIDNTTNSTKANTKATTDNQKNLANYDELNVMQDETTASSNNFTTANILSGISDFANKLKEAFKKGDYKDLGKIVATKINNALAKIKWTNIRKTVTSWAKNIANFLNGAVEKLNWTLMGSTIGNGLMTAVDFAYTFLTVFNWKKFGTQIATALNGILKSIDFKKLGATLGKVIYSVFSFVLGLAKKFNWAGLGTALRDTLKSLFENVDMNTVIQALTTTINGLFISAITLIGNPDFSELGSNTAKALIDTLNQIDWENISTLFTTLITGAFDFIDGFVLEIDWETLGENIATSFTDFFSGKGAGNVILSSLGQTLCDVIFGVLTSLDTIAQSCNWKEFGQNLAKSLTIDTSDDAWQNKLAKTASDIVNALLDLINGVFGEQKSADKLANGFSKMLGNIDWETLFIKALSGIVNIGSWLIQLAGDLVEDFCQGMATGFSDSKNNEELNNAVTDLAKSIGNLFITVIEAMLKIIVNGIPNLVLSAFRLILEMVNYIGQFILGDEWYQQAETSLNENLKVDIPISLPRLATGTVVPASYGEFMAILGDNKQEPEVVSPLSTIKQAVKEAFAEGGFSNGNSEIKLTIVLDSKTLFDATVSENKKYIKSHGTSAYVT